MEDEDDKVRHDESRPVVLVIGNFSHEGLTAKIEAMGFRVINRNLRSTKKNWEKIIELLRQLSSQNLLAAVFVYMPTTTLIQVADIEYDEVRVLLIAELARADTIIFIHEDNLQGSIEPFPWQVRDAADSDDSDIPWGTNDADYDFRRDHGLLTTEEWKELYKDRVDRALVFLESLGQARIDIAPFRKRSDVTIRIFEALEDSQSGTFLRLYVPHGRYQSEQFEDFLTLFSRYLREVEGKEFSVDVNRTSKGTTYLFKGRGDASSVDDLQAAVKRFDDFVCLAEINPESAKGVLEHAGVDASSAQFLVAKYSRQIKRLKLDVKHEYQRRRLLLSQELESEVLEGNEGKLLPVPEEARPSSIFSVVGNTGSVTIQIGSGAEFVAGSASVQKLIGEIAYTEEDKRLIELIERVEDRVEALKLRSELDRLKDPAISPEQKRTSVQRLKGFLYGVGKYVVKKVDEVGTAAIISYLEKMISGSP